MKGFGVDHEPFSLVSFTTPLWLAISNVSSKNAKPCGVFKSFAINRGASATPSRFLSVSIITLLLFAEVTNKLPSKSKAIMRGMLFSFA